MVDKVSILLVGESAPTEGSLRAQIESLGCPLEVVTELDKALRAVESGQFDVVVIDATAPDVDAFLAVKHIKRMTRERLVPVAFACHAHDLQTEIASREAGADDCFAKPIDTRELAARIRLLLRNRTLERELRAEHMRLEELNAEVRRARHMLDRELDFAGVIQRSLLPRTLPDLEQYQFTAALRPSGEVSGDFYDLYRLDETHYGFYIADAVGHGVPAALLTVFVKKGIETRDLVADGYRLLSPAEVLERLNHDIMSQKLSESPFVTLGYSILDVEEHTLCYASGGHPPPIVLGADGSAVPLLSEGALLGVFVSAFTTGIHQFRPGDTVVHYTDGVETALFGDKIGLDAVVEYMRSMPMRPDEPDSPEARRAFAGHVAAALDTIMPPFSSDIRSDDATLLVLRRWK